jgi:predicted nucleotidyltransferase
LPKRTSRGNSSDLRRKVAREAAALLYFGSEKEYKQAKLKAAESFRAQALPSNLEVAIELDKIAEETEGAYRTKRLIQMRTDALEIMKTLRTFCPLLIGSVWRGTIRRGSDIDIEVYSDESKEIETLVKNTLLRISKTERVTVTEHGETTDSLHIYAETKTKSLVEIIVRGSEEAGRKRTCDTFGDEIKGLTIPQLEKLMKENPCQQFIPS